MLWVSLVLLFFFFFFFFFMGSVNIMVLELNLFSLGCNNISLDLVGDFYSFLFFLTVGLISFCIFLFSKFYMDEDKTQLGFSLLLFGFVLSMVLLIFSPNLIMMLLGWDGLGLTSYLLVVYYMSVSSSVAGTLTFLMNRLGDIFFLFSISFFVLFLSWDFYFSKFVFSFFSFFLVMAFITKSAQIPFSSWLPAAMAAPTPVSSLVHSSTLVTAGVFLLIRFCFLVKGVSNILFILSLVTLMSAGVMANLEWDMKKLIAYSTLSQLGFMVISFSMGMVLFSFFHLTAHALFKASLFMSSGVLIHGSDNSQEFRNLSSMFFSKPLVSTAALVCVLCLMGFPFSTGFFSKDLLLDGGLVSSFFFFFFLFSVLLTIGYSFRFAWYLLVEKSFSRVKAFYLYENSLWLVGAIWFLIFWSVFSGAQLFEMFYSMKVFIFTTGGWKSIYFFFVFFFSCGSALISNKLFFLSFRHFFSKMFFLNTLMVSKKMIFGLSSYLFNKNDQGVLEVVGPQGSLNWLMSLSLSLGFIFQFSFLFFWLIFFFFFNWL